MTSLGYFRPMFERNRFLIGVISVVFFAVMVISAIVVYILLGTSSLEASLSQFLKSQSALVAIPRPYTSNLYWLIFLNNIGHFWNPLRVLVWVPLLGSLELGYELLLNAVIIGGVASLISVVSSPWYAVAGLMPHGIIEIPAFILEFTSLARWHVTMTRAISSKMGGRGVDRTLLKEGIKDTVVLSVLSVALFAIAAYVETYVTPRFLGL